MLRCRRIEEDGRYISLAEALCIGSRGYRQISGRPRQYRITIVYSTADWTHDVKVEDETDLRIAMRRLGHWRWKEETFQRVIHSWGVCIVWDGLKYWAVSEGYLRSFSGLGLSLQPFSCHSSSVIHHWILLWGLEFQAHADLDLPQEVSSLAYLSSVQFPVGNSSW